MSSSSASCTPTSGERSLLHDRLEKFRHLHQRRNEARMGNSKDVAEETKQPMPTSFQQQTTPADISLSTKNAHESPPKPDRVDKEITSQERSLHFTEEEVEEWDKKLEKKRQRADMGFSDYRTASLKKYHRLTEDLKVDYASYEALKSSLSHDDLYPTLEHRPPIVPVTERRIDTMVKDLESQMKRRRGYSRRRRVIEDNIDYINERNRRFNQKIQRAFGHYTQDMKDSLERGTAL